MRQVWAPSTGLPPSLVRPGPPAAHLDPGLDLPGSTGLGLDQLQPMALPRCPQGCPLKRTGLSALLGGWAWLQALGRAMHERNKMRNQGRPRPGLVDAGRRRRRRRRLHLSTHPSHCKRAILHGMGWNRHTSARQRNSSTGGALRAAITRSCQARRLAASQPPPAPAAPAGVTAATAPVAALAAALLLLLLLHPPLPPPPPPPPPPLLPQRCACAAAPGTAHRLA